MRRREVRKQTREKRARKRQEVATGKRFEPLFDLQDEIREAFLQKDALFLVGPAGSSKSFLAAALSAEHLANNPKSKLYLTRPAVESGEKIGFLPGDIGAKLNPYLVPFYESLQAAGMDPKALEKDGYMEICPIGFARGRTWGPGVAVLDEAQNCRPEEFKLWLTRQGKFAKLIVTGDPSQSDIKAGERFEEFITAIEEKNDPRVAVFRLEPKHIVRHDLVSLYLDVFEDLE